MMPPNLVIDAHGCANSRKGHRGRRKGLLPPIFPPLYCRTEGNSGTARRTTLKQASRRAGGPACLSALCAISFPLMQIFIVRSCCTFSGRFLFWRILLRRENGQHAASLLLCNSAHVHAKLCSKTPLLLRRPQLELTSVGGI